MSVSVGGTLRDAVERLLTVPGLMIVALFLAFRLGNLTIYKTFFGAGIEFGLERAGYAPGRLEAELMEEGYFMAAEAVRKVTEAGLDTSFPVAVALIATLPFIAEFLHVVGVRALAADDPNSVPVDEILDGLGMAYVKSLIANFVAGVLILLGTVLLLIPGIALLILFFFVRQRVVLAGDGVFEAISQSYSLVKENALAMFALGTIFWLTWIVLTFLSSAVLSPISGLLARAVTTVVIVFGISLLTSAYLQAVGGAGPQVSGTAAGQTEELGA